MSVTERGRYIATFRYVSVKLMETAAAWTPTTPELEVKVMLGRHLWDYAQHADALGRRTFELRLPLQHSLRPAEPFADLLDEVAEQVTTVARLSQLYGGVLPDLVARYEDYLRRTDTVLDAPSRVIVERILGDLARHREDCRAVSAEIGIETTDAAALRERLAGAGALAAPQEARG